MIVHRLWPSSPQSYLRLESWLSLYWLPYNLITLYVLVSNWYIKKWVVLILNSANAFLDTGKILKVVFVGTTTYDPVVAEEITVSLSILLLYWCSTVLYCLQLDPTSNDAVKELRVEGGSSLSERHIYAVTESRVYRLPLQRCSRLQGCK